MKSNIFKNIYNFKYLLINLIIVHIYNIYLVFSITNIFILISLVMCYWPHFAIIINISYKFEKCTIIKKEKCISMADIEDKIWTKTKKDILLLW